MALLPNSSNIMLGFIVPLLKLCCWNEFHSVAVMTGMLVVDVIAWCLCDEPITGLMKMMPLWSVCHVCSCAEGMQVARRACDVDDKRFLETSPQSWTWNCKPVADQRTGSLSSLEWWNWLIYTCYLSLLICYLFSLYVRHMLTRYGTVLPTPRTFYP